MVQERTQGEKRVERLLGQLNRDRYFYKAEYRIIGEQQSLYPDFVLVIRDLGMLVIEVKDYIEVLEGSTAQTLKIKRKDGTLAEERNPEQQARKYAQDLSNHLLKRVEFRKKNKKKPTLAFRWQPIVVYPNLSRDFIDLMGRYNVTDPRTTWGREDLMSVESIEHAIERAMHGQSPVPKHLMDGIFNDLRGVIDPKLIVTDQQGQDIGTLSIEQEYLTFEALKASEDMSIRLVRGVAGSGKSLILLRRARYLAEKHPDARIMIMTYNKDLAQSLSEKVHVPQVEVINFHKQCVQVFKSVGQRWDEPIKRIGWLEQHHSTRIQQSGMTIDFVDDEIKWRKEMQLHDNNVYLTIERKGRGGALLRAKREVINYIYTQYQKHQDSLKQRKAAWWDWEDVATLTAEFLTREKCHIRGVYDVVMIDEAQDFAPVWIDAVKKMLKPNGTLFLCDDPTQSLFREFSWREKGVEVVGRSRVLQVPFRNTRQIAQASHALVQADPLITASDIPMVTLQTSELNDGQLPVLQHFSSQYEEVNGVRNRAIQWLNEAKGTKVAILCHNKRDVKNWAGLRDAGVYVESFGRMLSLHQT